MICNSCTSQNEKGRYVPFSKMLNTILMEFRDKEYSIIPRPSSHDNKEEIVFLSNDPAVIKSHYLIRDTQNPDQQKSYPKCKPEIIGLFLSHSCEKCREHNDADFKAMVERIGRGHIPIATKVGAMTSEKSGKQLYVKGDSKGKRKRNDNDDDDGDDDDGDDDDKKDHPAKKSRSDSSGKLYNNGPPPDVQCAYYGAERLAALFSITHSIVILLTGKSTLPLLCQFLTCGY